MALNCAFGSPTIYRGSNHQWASTNLIHFEVTEVITSMQDHAKSQSDEKVI